MWHPFDLMPADLAVPDNLKTTAQKGAVRRVYSQRVTRWYSDKSSRDTQWPPTVDKRPGITLTIRPGSDRIELRIEQQWLVNTDHALSGTITCLNNPWRSPEQWQLKQTFTTKRGNTFLPSIEESGQWQNGKIQTLTQLGKKELRNSLNAADLTSFYTLLADFPAPESLPKDQAVYQTEALSFIPSARIEEAPALYRNHPLAKGLRGFTVKTASDIPADYWLNENGVVIYVCWGPNRAFVLETSEELA